MQKDFDRWNNVKKAVDSRTDLSDVYFREREVWWCNLGVNVGFEQDGKGLLFKRPVLILKKFNPRVFIALPLSLRTKENPYYFRFADPDGNAQSAIISQLRLLDVRRLSQKAFTIDHETFAGIKEAVRQLFV